jgi:hypothetical protein
MTKVNPVPEQSTVRGCPESCFALVQGKILKMKRGNLKKVFINSVLILLGFIFGSGISVFAWVNPSQSPPLGGGVLQTDNSGLKIVTTTQIISGNLTVNTGNVGIGTTNPNNLLQVVDLINFDNTDFNTFLGYQAGKNVVSGAQYNTFIGYQAGFSSSTAASSTADYNTAIGYQALYSNTTGYYNTAVGSSALYSNTEGTHNTALGSSALYSNTEGYYNIAIGRNALYSNTEGGYNIAIGRNALYSNTSNFNNIAIGNNALYSNSGGSYNTAVGNNALYSNTTGLYNTAIGIFALYSNTEGGVNTAVGPYALYNNTTGDSNTAVGDGALLRNTTGYYNTAVGSNAGSYTGDSTTSNATSTYSVYLGAHTRASFSGATNEIVIGYGAVGAGSNSVVLGNDSITRTILKGNVGIGTTTPTAKLHLIHPSRGEIKLLATSGVGHDFGYNGGIDSIFWFTHTGTSTGYTLFRWDDGISSRDLLYIGNNGNVGIGTTTPEARLHIVGGGTTDVPIVKIYGGNSRDAPLELRAVGSDGVTALGIIEAVGVGGHSGTATEPEGLHLRSFKIVNGVFYDSWMRFMGSKFSFENGNVGIGTSTPSQRLTVVGNIGIQAGSNAFIGTLDNYALSLRTNNTDRIFITNAGNVGIGTTAPSTRLAVAGLTSSQAGRTICSDPSGNFYYYVGSCVSSSIKYKTNIQNLGIGLETLLKLRPVTFEFKKDYGGYDGTIHMGFIAEEVEKVSPLLVDYNNGEVSGVRYNEMTALIVKSIQEQQKEIEDLKKEVEELKRIITR